MLLPGREGFLLKKNLQGGHYGFQEGPGILWFPLPPNSKHKPLNSSEKEKKLEKAFGGLWRAAEVVVGSLGSSESYGDPHVSFF